MEDTNTSLAAHVPSQDAGGGIIDIQVGLTLFGAFSFIVAFVGNATVIHIIRMRRHMRNITNILIANMSAADLLITVLMFPYLCKYYFVGAQWFGGIAGSITCVVLHSSQMISIFCSVYTLLVISIDRCLGVLWPLKRYFTMKVTKFCIIGVWSASILFSIPLMVATKVTVDQNTSAYFCIEDWPSTGMSNQVFMILFILLTYAIPLVLIGSAYAVTGHKLWGSTSSGQENPLNRSNQKSVRASRRKATKMLITVVLLFALCWFPFQLRELIWVTSPAVLKAMPFKLDIVLPWFGLFNSCINPFIYIVFSDRFRREFKRVLCFWKSPDPTEVFSSPMTHTRLHTIKNYHNVDIHTPNGSPHPSKKSNSTSI